METRYRLSPFCPVFAAVALPINGETPMTTRSLYIAFAAAAYIAGAAQPSPVLANPSSPIFARLSGTWMGRGQVTFEKGQTEQLSCRAYYTPKSENSTMGLAIRCASASYKLEMRANLQFAGNHVSGSWEERTFNATGTVDGSAGDSDLKLAIAGVLSGAMSVKMEPSGHRVDFRPQSAEGLKNVAINFARG
jgi:hypothetical protein